jgi:signal transduction histidine kinase
MNMNTSAHSFSKMPANPDVLGELLHSLSQPLTSLRCSLELSLDHERELSLAQIAERQHESVAAALQQTEKVIGMIRLMREYLDAENAGTETLASPFAPVVRSVIDDLSSIAEIRHIQLRLVGTCSVTLPLPESRLRLAMQYLITAMIDAEKSDPETPYGKITLLLGEGPAGAVLRAESDRRFHPQRRDKTSSQMTLCRARLAVATRVLENAGASLVFHSTEFNPAGFVLRVPR